MQVKSNTIRKLSQTGFIRRLITAAFFVLIMLLGLYGGRYSFVLLFAVITGGCLWEFLSMSLERTMRRDRIRKLIGLLLGLMPVLFSFFVQLGFIQKPTEFIVLAAGMFSPLVFFGFVYELYTGSKYPFQNIAWIILGMFYIGIPFALLGFIAFEGEHFYANTVFGLLLLSWMNDTGAYVMGSLFGKTPLFPRISPKKTWEGTIGGMVTTIIVALLLSLFIKDLTLLNWFVVGAIVAIFGTLGDLVESMLKRSVRIKDSGKILPGHGGLLDRFDAFIFILPYVAAYLLWIR